MTNKGSETRGAEAADVAWRGIELCREGDWTEGLYWLSLAAGQKGKKELPSLFYAYLGYGMAKYRRQKAQGLKLCRRAVELEFYQPENYLFLARTCLLLDDRRSAIDAIERGIEIDSTHEGLLELKRELGNRRPPMLPFLSRTNFLNRLLGKLRHGLLGSRSKGGSSSDTPPSNS